MAKNICFALLLLFAFSPPVNSLRRSLPPIRLNLPLKMPPPLPPNSPQNASFSPPQIRLFIFATIRNSPIPSPTLATERRDQIKRESGQKKSKNIRKLADISKQEFERKMKNGEEEGEKEKWTKMLMDEMGLGQNGTAEKGEMGPRSSWQLFSRCSGAFMAINGKNRVEARRGQKMDKCNSHFLAESVPQGDWAFRGQILLKHVRTGQYICLGKRRGIVAKTNPGRSPFCRFRDHLTPSGHSQFLSIRPLGFSPSGRPFTRPQPNHWRRCFQFTKLDDWKGADCFGRQRRAREGEWGHQAELREIERRTLLAKIEAMPMGEETKGDLTVENGSKWAGGNNAE